MLFAECCKQEVSGYELNGSNKLRQYFDTNNASWDRANGRTAWGCLGSLKLCNTWEVASFDTFIKRRMTQWKVWSYTCHFTQQPCKVQSTTSDTNMYRCTDWQTSHHTQPHHLKWHSLPLLSNGHQSPQTPTMVGLWVAPPMPHPHPSHCSRDGVPLSLTPGNQMCCLLSDPGRTADPSSALCAMLHRHHS